MTNTLTSIRLSRNIIRVAVTTAFAMAILLSASLARAEYPNIIVGQDLTIGSTGQNVVVLQGLMTELGFLNVPSGIAFGYYGSLTKNAVARYQSSMNVTPPVGYFGPLTKTSMHNDFAGHGYLSMLNW